MTNVSKKKTNEPNRKKTLKNRSSEQSGGKFDDLKSVFIESTGLWQFDTKNTKLQSTFFTPELISTIVKGYTTKLLVPEKKITQHSDILTIGLNPTIQSDLFIWGANANNHDKVFNFSLDADGQTDQRAPYKNDAKVALSHPNYLGIITTQYKQTKDGNVLSTTEQVIADINQKFDSLELYVKNGGKVHIPRDPTIFSRSKESVIEDEKKDKIQDSVDTIQMGLGVGLAEQQDSEENYEIQQDLLYYRVAKLSVLKLKDKLNHIDDFLTIYANTMYNTKKFLPESITKSIKLQVNNFKNPNFKTKLFNAVLILPKKTEDKTIIRDIKQHLLFRHPIHFKKDDKWSWIHEPTFTSLFGYSKRLVYLFDAKVRGRLRENALDNTTCPGDTRLEHLWYGILGWTDWVFSESVFADPDLINQISKDKQTEKELYDQYRPTKDGAYILHTWGVNLENNLTPHYKFCFSNIDKAPVFNEDNYKKLLNNTLNVIQNAISHLNNKYKGKILQVRISKLGFGAWKTKIPLERRVDLLNYYKDKLLNMHIIFTTIITFVNFNEETGEETYSTSSIEAGTPKWTEYGNNRYYADPFGPYIENDNDILLLVNAWDDASFIGNGGTLDDTLDGWMVTGDVSKEKQGLNNQPLGYYAQNYSYFHNVFFQPQLLADKNWIGEKGSMLDTEAPREPKDQKEEERLARAREAEREIEARARKARESLLMTESEAIASGFLEKKDLDEFLDKFDSKSDEIKEEITSYYDLLIIEAKYSNNKAYKDSIAQDEITINSETSSEVDEIKLALFNAKKTMKETGIKIRKKILSKMEIIPGYDKDDRKLEEINDMYKLLKVELEKEDFKKTFDASTQEILSISEVMIKTIKNTLKMSDDNKFTSKVNMIAILNSKINSGKIITEDAKKVVEALKKAFNVNDKQQPLVSVDMKNNVKNIQNFAEAIAKGFNNYQDMIENEEKNIFDKYLILISSSIDRNRKIVEKKKNELLETLTADVKKFSELDYYTEFNQTITNAALAVATIKLSYANSLFKANGGDPKFNDSVKEVLGFAKFMGAASYKYIITNFKKPDDTYDFDAYLDSKDKPESAAKMISIVKNVARNQFKTDYAKQIVAALLVAFDIKDEDTLAPYEIFIKSDKVPAEVKPKERKLTQHEEYRRAAENRAAAQAIILTKMYQEEAEAIARGFSNYDEMNLYKGSKKNIGYEYEDKYTQMGKNSTGEYIIEEVNDKGFLSKLTNEINDASIIIAYKKKSTTRYDPYHVNKKALLTMLTMKKKLAEANVLKKDKTFASDIIEKIETFNKSLREENQKIIPNEVEDVISIAKTMYENTKEFDRNSDPSKDDFKELYLKNRKEAIIKVANDRLYSESTKPIVDALLISFEIKKDEFQKHEFSEPFKQYLQEGTEKITPEDYKNNAFAVARGFFNYQEMKSMIEDYKDKTNYYDIIPIFVKTTKPEIIEEEIKELRGFTELAKKPALNKDEYEVINKASVEMITARLELLHAALESKKAASTKGKNEDELVAAIQTAVDTKIALPSFKDTIAIARKIGELGDLDITSASAIEAKLKEIITDPNNPILVGLQKVFGLTPPLIPVISPARPPVDKEYKMDPKDEKIVKAMEQNIEAAIAKAKEIAQAKNRNTEPLPEIITAGWWGQDITLTLLAEEEANLELKEKDKIYTKEWILWRESQLVNDWKVKYEPKLWETYKKQLIKENDKIKQKHTAYQQLEAAHKKKWMDENAHKDNTPELNSLWNEKKHAFYWSELTKLANEDVKKYAIGIEEPERSAWYRWWLNEKKKDWFKKYEEKEWIKHRETLPPNLLKPQKQDTPGLGLEQGRTPLLPPRPQTIVDKVLSFIGQGPEQEQRQVLGQGQRPVLGQGQRQRQVLGQVQPVQPVQDPQAIISSMYQEENSSSYMFYIPIVGILIGISSMFLIK
jgi:hypothetical protein